MAVGAILNPQLRDVVETRRWRAKPSAVALQPRRIRAAFLERFAIACTVRSLGFSRNVWGIEPFRLKAGLQTFFTDNSCE